MIKTLIFVLLFVPFFLYAQVDNPCNIESLKISNSRDLTEIDCASILMSMDSICLNNAEYCEFFNETLFMILDGSPSIVIKTIEKYKSNIQVGLIYNEIENPVNDIIDLKAIRLKILNTPECEEKVDIIKRLDIAIEKYDN